jgi:hypothetical protein
VLDRSHKIERAIAEIRHEFRHRLYMLEVGHRLMKIVTEGSLADTARTTLNERLSMYGRLRTYLLHALSTLPEDDEERLAALVEHNQTYIRLLNDADIETLASTENYIKAD